MKSLAKLRLLAKLGKVFSRIIFVLCVVGAVLCVAGIIFVAVFGDVSIAGTRIGEWVTNTPSYEINALYATLVTSLIFCILEGELCHESVGYFTYTVSEGTPFSVEGAKKLKKLGIKATIHPIIILILNTVVYECFSLRSELVLDADLGNSGELILGICIIIVSLILRCGAELEEEHKTTDKSA